MIKLANILKEIKEKRLAFSWQKPDGNFVPIDYSHKEAYRYAHAEDEVIVMLWKKGWQRITHYDTAIYANNEFTPPNDKQKSKLIELATILHRETVEWDSGSNKGTKIIWSVHNILEESVDNLSRKKRLIPLIKLARQYDTFEDFQKDYQLKNYHGIYWHLTKDVDFKIDPRYSPQDYSTLSIGDSETLGLMVSTDLSNWKEYFSSKKYAAQIDLSDLKPNTDYKQVTRGFEHEIYVFKPEGAKVVKTYPIRNALAINLRDYKQVLPQSQEELKKLYWFAKQGSVLTHTT